MRQAILVVVSLMVLTSSQGLLVAQSGSAAEGEARLRGALAQTIENQDLEGSVGLYEPDAVFLSPAGRFSDRAAIRTLYRSVFLAYRGQIQMTSKRQIASGDLCVDDGSYSEVITELATGKKTALTGDYVLVARRQGDGYWKVAEMVWTQTSTKPL